MLNRLAARLALWTALSIVAGTGGALTFKSDAGSASLTATAGTHTVAADATLASNLAVAVAADSLTVTGVLDGTGPFAERLHALRLPLARHHLSAGRWRRSAMLAAHRSSHAGA